MVFISSKNFSLSALHYSLYRVLLIRSIVLALQLAVWCWAWLTDLEFKTLYQVLYILAISAIITAISFARVRLRKPLTEFEFLIQLLVDVFGLTMLLYFSGGSTNPFVSYYLIPITIAAAALPRRHTAIVAVTSLFAYSLLLFYYHPMGVLAPDQQHHDHQAGLASLNLHVLGMWGNFVMSTFLITYFVAKMAIALRQQERELSSLREDELRNEQILGIATLAAGTAHELGTPLSTMKVLATDLLGEEKTEAGKKDVALLLNQIELCQAKLKELVQTASYENPPPTDVNSYVEKILQDWQLLRQEVRTEIQFAQNCPKVHIAPPKTLEQSIFNLLDNGADASPDKLLIDIEWDSHTLTLRIRDYGEGIPESMVNELGRVFITNKEGGLGIGLLLTHATITHFGGSVCLYRREHGTLTEVVLPLDSFIVESSLL